MARTKENRLLINDLQLLLIPIQYLVDNVYTKIESER